jgi:hypothetical protein
MARAAHRQKGAAAWCTDPDKGRDPGDALQGGKRTRAAGPGGGYDAARGPCSPAGVAAVRPCGRAAVQQQAQWCRAGRTRVGDAGAVTKLRATIIWGGHLCAVQQRHPEV